MSKEEEASEHYRIHVPHPDSEIIVGEGPSGFIGIVHRVSNGGMFFGAGGYGFGIGSADSTYAGFRKAHTALGIAIGGTQLVAQFLRAGLMGREANCLSVTVNAVAFGLGPLAGTIGAIETGGLTTPEGTIAVYGEKTVALASPINVNLTGGIAASLTGGVAASLNGIVSSTVNGVTAGVFGAYSATVAGAQTKIVGDAETTVSTRDGKTTIEGTTVQVGARSSLEPGMAYRGFLTGGQKATSSVDIVADDAITIAPGADMDRVRGTSTKIVATPDDITLQAQDAGITMTNNILAHSGGSGFVMTPARIKLWQSPVALTTLFNKAVQAAEIAWVAETKLADTIKKTAKDKTELSASYAGILATVGLGVALGTTHKMSDGPRAGVAIGGTAAGAALGGLGVWALVSHLEEKMTQTAREIARKIADKKYRAACMLAGVTTNGAAQAASSLPTSPKVDLSSNAVVINVGPSKIRVMADSIEITTMPGLDVKINGQTFKNTVPGALEVG